MYNGNTSQRKQEISSSQLPKFTVKFEIENVIVKQNLKCSSAHVMQKVFCLMSLNYGRHDSFVQHSSITHLMYIVYNPFEVCFHHSK